MAVYILHFDEKFHHAQHYIGFTIKDTIQAVKDRFEKHKKGNGSKLMRSVFSIGINVRIATIFLKGDRSFERKLKNKSHAKKYCNICNKNLINYGDWDGQEV